MWNEVNAHSVATSLHAATLCKGSPIDVGFIAIHLTVHSVHHLTQMTDETLRSASVPAQQLLFPKMARCDSQNENNVALL